jgi:hypothetical protein
MYVCNDDGKFADTKSKDRQYNDRKNNMTKGQTIIYKTLMIEHYNSH